MVRPVDIGSGDRLKEGPDCSQDFGGLGVGQPGAGVSEYPLVHGHHAVGTYPTVFVQLPCNQVGRR